ncbi:MAG TPA: GNAT family N-acetyltransferase, partial [Pseudolabrys sp.]|nr:GNAT family N-acetyltransferase [Pseudolabrys sp.]
DKSLELPPLNTALARAQIDRTRIAKLLHGYRDRPAADIEGVVNVLVQLSRIAVDQPQVTELDINPLLCDTRGVIAVDGRVRVKAAVSGAAEARLAIRPYPKRLETTVTARDGKTYAVRPIRPEDELRLRAFADAVDGGDLWHPFFAPLRTRTHETAARLSQIDYDREMTLVAWDGNAVVGLARSVSDPDFDTAECAVIIRADRREQGLALALIDTLCRTVAALGIRRAALVFPQDRARMVRLAKELGFAMAADAGDANQVRAVKSL